MVPISSIIGLFGFLNRIDTLSAILFIIGLLLLVVEMFIPGFGIAGGSGIVLLVIGIILTATTPAEAMVMIGILLALVALVLFVILRSARKGKLSKLLVLRSAAKHESGYSATADFSALAGKEGVAMTVLRPAGSGEFAGQRLDVVTDGTFIEKGTRIRIIRTEGRRIVVEAVQPTTPSK